MGPRSVFLHILVVELYSFSLNWSREGRDCKGAKTTGALRTHLVIGKQKEGLLAERWVPGEGCGHCTLLNTIHTQELEIVLTAVGQIILHLRTSMCMCVYEVT